MALRAASFVSVSRRSARCPRHDRRGHLGVEARELRVRRRHAHGHAALAVDLRVLARARGRDLAPHLRGLRVLAALDRLHHDPALARLADVAA
jgi:hypothetical protein